MVEAATTQRLPVRFYFAVEIDFLVPQKPHLHQEKPITDEFWVNLSVQKLEHEVEDNLHKTGFQGILRTYRLISDEHRLYRAILSVSSRPHYFGHAEFRESKQNPCCFTIKPAPLSKAKIKIAAELSSLLERLPVVQMTYEYHTSRTFIFGVHLAGYLEIRNTFSPETIKGCGGSIQNAISEFNEEVQAALSEYLTWDAEPKSLTRRPSNGIYKFDLHATVQMQFAEDEVYGDMSCLNDDMSTDEELPELDFSDDICEVLIEQERRFVSDALAHYDVVSFGCNYVDYDDDYNIADGLA